MLEPVQHLCQRHDLPWDDQTADRLRRFLELLDEFRGSMNLIGPLSHDAIIRELLADSLAPAAVRAPNGPVLDVGTGAGFPGVPLACLYPELPVTLVEPRKKRHTFLKIVRTRLDLEQLTLQRARLENLEPKPHDFVISKAFKPPDEWIPLAARWVATDREGDSPGAAICMTRPDQRKLIVDAAADAGMELINFVADTADIGAPAADPPRAIAVLAHA
jgi:16S rRNA (guanine527-N7)-methyltransferase